VTPNERFIKELKKLRSGPGWTLRGFARGLGISPSYLSDLERGNRMPSVALIEKLCELPHGPSNKTWHRIGAGCHGWNV